MDIVNLIATDMSRVMMMHIYSIRQWSEGIMISYRIVWIASSGEG